MIFCALHEPGCQLIYAISYAEVHFEKTRKILLGVSLQHNALRQGQIDVRANPLNPVELKLQAVALPHDTLSVAY